MPSDGIGVAEADEGGFVSKVGDHLGQAKVGECDDALGEGERERSGMKTK